MHEESIVKSANRVSNGLYIKGQSHLCTIHLCTYVLNTGQKVDKSIGQSIFKPFCIIYTLLL